MLTIEWVRSKRIMLKSELEVVNVDEYIGALADFTGEIGRIAVNKAAIRDFTSVVEILQADLCIAFQLMQLNVGGKYTKKVDETTNNLKKVEDILYDLSLLQKGGRKGRERSAVDDSGRTNTKDDTGTSKAEE